MIMQITSDDNHIDLMCECANHTDDVNKLWAFAHSDIADVRYATAINIYTPLEILEYLVDDSDFRVRAAVAQSCRLSIDVCWKLAKDTNATVRYMIATNVNLADILTFLSDDIDDKVRRAVACNLNTPIPACQKLTKDANQTVSYWAWLRFTYTIY